MRQIEQQYGVVDKQGRKDNTPVWAYGSDCAETFAHQLGKVSRRARDHAAQQLLPLLTRCVCALLRVHCLLQYSFHPDRSDLVFNSATGLLLSIVCFICAIIPGIEWAAAQSTAFTALDFFLQFCV